MNTRAVYAKGDVTVYFSLRCTVDPYSTLTLTFSVLQFQKQERNDTRHHRWQADRRWNETQKAGTKSAAEPSTEQ
jgi:hypothetical protein